MAANVATLQLKIKVSDDGTVKVLDTVGQSAKKAGDEGKRGFDKMGQAAQGLQAQIVKVGTAIAAYLSIQAIKNYSTSAVMAYADQERQLLRLEGQIRATGRAGQTSSEQLEEMAQRIDKATLASAAGVRDAQAILMSFRAVATEDMERILMVAQDVAEVMGQDITSAARQMALALEDPAQGMSMLRRTGTTFTKDQQELIKSLHETGRVAEAQNEILKVMESQYGGTAEAAGKGLAGSLDNLNRVTTNLRVEVGKQMAPAVDQMVNRLSAWVGENDALLKQRMPEYFKGMAEGLISVGSAMGWIEEKTAFAAKWWAELFYGPADAKQRMQQQLNDLKAQREAVLGLIDQRNGWFLSTFDPRNDRILSEHRQELEGLDRQIRITEAAIAGMGREVAKTSSEVKTGAATQNQAAVAAETYSEAAQKVISALQWEIQTLGLTADEQFRLTKLKEAGVEADSKAGREITKFADALAKARREMELSEEVDWFLADEREQAAKNLKAMGDEATRWIEATRRPLEVYQRQLAEIEKLHKAGLFGEGAAGADNYARARQKALDDYVSANYRAASEIDEIWENTRNRMQDALAGFFADMASGELDSIKDYMAGIGRASGEIFAAHLSQAIIKGINSSQFINDLELVFNDIFGSAFSGDQIAAGIMGTLSAAIAAIQSGDGGRMAGTGAGAGMGLLLSGGNPMGMALGASAGGMIGGMFGSSGPSAQTLFMQGLRDVAEDLRRNTEALQRNLMEQYPGQAKTAQLAADTFDTVWEAINGKVKLNSGALGSIMPANMQGIAALAAPGNRTDAYRQYLGAMSDIAPGLYDGMDPEAMGGRIKKHLDTFFDYIFEVASNSIAQIQEQAMQWADTIGADLDQWASRLGTGPTAAEKAMADYTDKTLPYLSTINDQAQGLTAVLETVTDPAQRAMIQERIDQLWGFADAIQRLGPAITEFYAGNRADILAQMDRDLNPLSGLDAALADVTDRGEAYRDQLVDNGMAVAEAEERTRAWTEAMKDAVREEMIGNAERDLTIRLLRAQGNAEAALNMEREGQIEALRRQFGGLSGPLEDIAREIWRIEDAARGLAAATSAVESARAAYMSAAQRQLSSAQAGQAALESRYDEAKSAYVAALQQKIEAENAANQSRINSLNASAQAAGRAASEVERMADTFGRIADQIRDYRRNLLTGDSLIGVESRYKTARSEFEQAVSGIYSTDLAARQEALSKLPQMAGTFLSASKGVNASPGGYQQDLARVLAVLNTAEGMAEVGKSNAEKQLESALARQATLERQASMMSTHTSIYQKMLDEVEQDQADTRTFEQIQQEYLEAKAAFDHSSFTAEIEYWQAEIDRLDSLINATESVEAAFSTYSTALVNAIAGGYDDLKGSFAAELAALKDAAAIAPDGGTKAAASFAGGGTVRGPASGYTIPTTFHGTEHITPDSQMAEVKEVLADVRGVLIQIRDTAGAINLTSLKSHRILDRATQGGDKVRVVEAA